MVAQPKDRLAREIASKAYDGLQKHADACKEAYDRLDNAVGSVKASVAQAAVTMQQTTEKMDGFGEKLEQIRQALMGDELRDQPGLITRIKLLERAIHGDKDEPGMFVRRDQVMRYAIIIAVLSTLVGGGFGATAVNVLKLILGG